jgi:hypothetical protein
MIYFANGMRFGLIEMGQKELEGKTIRSKGEA